MSEKSKRVVLVIAAILLALLYGTIFLFSSQEGEASGSLSYNLSRFGVMLWDELTNGHLTEKMLNELALYFEHPLRKAAHFAEYAVMGVLVYTILFCSMTKEKSRFLICVFWVFLSAVADEIHQYFVPGRWGTAADVLLDTCGGITGALFCFLVIQSIVRRLDKKNKVE